MRELTEEERMEIDDIFLKSKRKIERAHADFRRELRDDERKAKRNLILQLITIWATVGIFLWWIWS